MEVALSIDQQRAAVAAQRTASDPTKIKGTDPKNIAFLNRLVSAHQRIEQVGEQPVTIVNLNPYALMVNDPLFDGIVVKAIKDGEPYSALVLREVKFQTDPGLDHNHVPVEFFPIQLASEFERQYGEKGGVFIIRGNLEKNPELALTDEFRRKFIASQEVLFGYAFKMKREGDKMWLDPTRKNSIHHGHRVMALILFREKRIAKLPDWIDAMPAREDIAPDCPACGTEQKKGVPMCSACAWVLDPAKAFKMKIIGETNVALERLTRAQVIELGVSAFVAETADEEPVRLAAGKPKPLSLFESRTIQQQQREEQSIDLKQQTKGK